jgi:hypothetical protein
MTKFRVAQPGGPDKGRQAIIQSEHATVGLGPSDFRPDGPAAYHSDHGAQCISMR